MASLNSTNGDYLSQFFKSSQTADADYTHALKLAKILDLELLQLELVSPGEVQLKYMIFGNSFRLKYKKGYTIKQVAIILISY